MVNADIVYWLINADMIFDAVPVSCQHNCVNNVDTDE